MPSDNDGNNGSGITVDPSNPWASIKDLLATYGGDAERVARKISDLVPGVSYDQALRAVQERVAPAPAAGTVAGPMGDLPKIEIGPELQPYILGDRLSREDAAKQLTDRFLVELGIKGPNLAGTLKDYILDTLGENNWTSALLSVVDFRPFVTGMATYLESHGVAADSPSSSAPAELQQMLLDLQFVQPKITAAEDKAAKGSTNAAGDQLEYPVDPTKAGLSPDAINAQYVQAVATGQIAPDQKVDSNADFIAAANTGGAATVTYDVDNIRMLLNTDQYTLEQILADEQAGTGTFPIQFQDRQTAFIGHGRIDRTAAGQGRKMSALTALDYLNTLSEAEVTTMQHRLADAGYFDRLGSPNVQINWGDALDPATRAAWKMLLTESAQRNVSLTTLIAENGKNYREQVRQTRLQSLDPINRNATAIVADDLAQQYLGRRLTGTEYEQLQGFLDSLRSDRAGYVQGASGPGNEAGMLPDALGFDRNDMEGYMRRTFGNETRGTAWDEMMYAADKRFS